MLYSEGLCLLVFDLKYCCNTYGYYWELVALVSGKTIKKSTKKGLTWEQIEEREAERLARNKHLRKSYLVWRKVLVTLMIFH